MEVARVEMNDCRYYTGYLFTGKKNDGDVFTAVPMVKILHPF